MNIKDLMVLFSIFISTSVGAEIKNAFPSQRATQILDALTKSMPLNVSDPLFSCKESGIQLGAPLNPVQSEIKKAFQNFMNIDFFRENTTLPQGREERTGYADDLALQRGLQIQINSGHIQKGDLIISDTGHDIPLAAQLFKNYPYLHAQAVFYYPQPLIESEGTNDRLLSQAQDWATDIGYYQKQHAHFGLPEVLFVGIEGHRREYNGQLLYKVPFEHFPSWEQLKIWGIQRVVYITERSLESTQDQVKKVISDDLSSYLRTSSLPIIFLGVDCRRGNGC